MHTLRACAALCLVAACGPDDTTTVTTPDVPLVDEALDGNCPGGEPAENGVDPGDDLHKVTLDAYPEALCNDGTPAIFYVREAAAPAAADVWVIHHQAGGSCGSYEVCLQRWCGIGSYHADKMSSAFAPEVANGAGLFSRGDNDFGPANQVYLYYCSSDSWGGQRSDAVLEDPTGANVPFRLHFRGHSILEAVADALAAGVTSDDGAMTLPPLGDATDVLFSGSSAGAKGLSAHLDWWAARVPEARVGGVIDGALWPDLVDVTDADVAANYEIGMQFMSDETEGALYEAFREETCLTAHADDPSICILPGHVLLNHVTTPFFVRQDLTDPVVYNNILGPTGATVAQAAGYFRTSLLRLADVPTEAEEAGDIVRAPGAYGTNCGQHIAMLNGPWFGTAAQGNAAVDGTTFHDALSAWALGGEDVQIVDTHPSSLSECAATTGDQ